jgi:hypothetical protein
MRGAIPPLPQYVFMARCLVKHRDNFTFTFIQISSDFNSNLFRVSATNASRIILLSKDFCTFLMVAWTYWHCVMAALLPLLPHTLHVNFLTGDILNWKPSNRNPSPVAKGLKINKILQYVTNLRKGCGGQVNETVRTKWKDLTFSSLRFKKSNADNVSKATLLVLRYKLLPSPS